LRTPSLEDFVAANLEELTRSFVVSPTGHVRWWHRR
jgi:hypothetical protein